MKAYVLHGVNDLRYEDTVKPEINENEVLVEVKAAGICGSDIPRIFETGTYHFPTIPGHEFSGIVKAAGSEKHKSLLNKKVGIFPLIPCKECASCRKGMYELCKSYNYLGSRCNGGFAEYVAVPVWNLLLLPEGVSFEAAAMLEPVSVALHAVNRTSFRIGNTAAIFGTGTIGLLMAQWFRIYGASEVYLIGTRAEQAELAGKLGFTMTCNTKEADPVEWIMEKTQNRGVDIAVEGVGLSSTLESCLEAVTPAGTILSVGNPKGDMNLSKSAYWQLLRKQIKMAGTWNSGFDDSDRNDWKTAVSMLESGRIVPERQITHKLPFDRLEEGLSIMKDKRVFTNKVMIIH